MNPGLCRIETLDHPSASTGKPATVQVQVAVRGGSARNAFLPCSCNAAV